jgi:sigma-B regulation protein RsbU (phosphoserine phosphatase)
MAGNLEALVATAAQKEALEKELQIARELQKSLIPGNLPSGGAVEFSSLFEPSAAIGGDYFDILRLDESRLAVIIADVSGHGLSTGLRMAMIKAALLILVQEEDDPEKILARLDAVVRSDTRTRFFVTATLALLDFREGTLTVTNAGHPPTYLLRGGQVEEILLPGSPLGGMGKTYGKRTLPLESGDTLVWLSDGLIEATNAADDVFGYDAVVEALRGPAASPTVVRDRLLAAIERHVQGEPPQDDRTLLVMRYLGG